MATGTKLEEQAPSKQSTTASSSIEKRNTDSSIRQFRIIMTATVICMSLVGANFLLYHLIASMDDNGIVRR